MKPLVVILGQTASGKSALALELARRLNGEIIAADSRTIYKGMDIGTAKPTAKERNEVQHHMLDVVDPDQTYSAAEFKKNALRAIDEISARGKLPILVGGSGLYIDSVIFDLQFGETVDSNKRDQLEKLSVEQLQQQILSLGYEMPENKQNKRYLIRQIERGGIAGGRSELRQSTLVIGLEIEKSEADSRIKSRVENMVESEFVQEVEDLLEKYPADSPGFLAPGYTAFVPFVKSKISLDEAKENFVRNDQRLAKKQRTWFRRPYYKNVIHWLQNIDEVVDLTTTFLNK